MLPLGIYRHIVVFVHQALKAHTVKMIRQLDAFESEISMISFCQKSQAIAIHHINQYALNATCN